MNHSLHALWIAIKLTVSGIVLLPVIAAAAHVASGGAASLGMIAALFIFGMLGLAPWLLPKWLARTLNNEDDLEHQPLTVFFREAVLRTVEGWIWMATTVAYLFAAALYMLGLPFVSVPNDARWVIISVFLGWPIISFIVFARLGSPHYTTRIFSTCCVAVFSLFGFWMVFT